LKKGLDYIKEWEAFVHVEDEEAFHELYCHYFKYLSFVGLKKGFPVNRVKDNVNDLFLGLWEKRGQLNNVINFHNYIVSSFLRKLYHKENLEIDGSMPLETLPELQTCPSVESQYISQHTQDDLSRILKVFVEKLPGKQKQMIYQKFYLGLSYKEISETNRVSINTVYNTVYKALEKLKVEIGKDNLSAFSLALALLSFLCLIYLKKSL
jgi:RNA polymerase sigma factor (sigma-70 family)